MEAITREEKIISGENLTPITRKEMFLAKAAGMDVETPEPITREEIFLSKIQGGNDGTGGGGESEDFTISDASYLFHKGSRMEALEQLCAKLKNITTCSEMFRDAVATTEQGSKYGNLSFSLDSHWCTVFSSMFRGCSELVSIPEFDTSKGKQFIWMFYGCTKLKTVPKIDINDATDVRYMFDSCQFLENLYLYNIRKSIQLGNGSSWGRKLTVDSLIHTIKELCSVESTQTLTIASDSQTKISGLYCKIIDDTNEKKPMELCESTDDGAMTLIDYAAEKGWTIA